MKYAISILVIFALLMITKSDALDGPVPATPVTLTVEVNGNPIIIYPANFSQTAQDILTLARGEEHIFSPVAGDPNECPRITFQMEKDYNRSAIVEMWIPDYPVHGVYLNGRWESTPRENSLTGTPIEGNLYHWNNPGDPDLIINGIHRAEEYIRLVITRIDAITTPPEEIVLGDAVFEINISADYY